MGPENPRLEARQDNTERWLLSIDGKVDQLLALANFGQGSLRTLLKMGVVIVTVVGVAEWALNYFRPH